MAFAAALICAAALAWGLTATMGAIPWQAIAYGRRVAPILRGLTAPTTRQADPIRRRRMNSSVVITQRGDQRFFYVSGKSEASSAPSTCGCNA